MLSSVRGSLNSWAVRLLFLVLLVAFVAWGVGDFVRNMGRGGGDYALRIGGRTVDPREFDQAFRRALSSVSRRTEPTPQVKRIVAGQTLQQLMAEESLDDEARRLRLAVPAEQLRATFYGLPEFRGDDGKFDPARARALLQANGLTEARLLDLLRRQLLAQQFLGAVRAGAVPPAAVTDAIFRAEGEKRSADLVSLPFASATPPAPTPAQLQRWYENHPDQYSTPEYRRIKAVVLLPDAVAKDIPVSDDELRTAYDKRAAEYAAPERRSAQVILVHDEAKARALATAWRGGAGWDAMRAQAAAAGGSAVEIPDAPKAEFPAAELAEAVFAAPQGTVPEPTHDALGWHVVRVTGISPAVNKDFDSVRDELREAVVASKAGNALFDRAQQIENTLGTGASLDELPGDLGLKAVTGTLDAAGKTPDGGDAPIPGPPALRAALVKAAFQETQGEPPHLKETSEPGGGAAGYYAVSVESVTKPEVKPFDAVADRVRADWTADARRHARDKAAARLLGAVRDGTGLADAAKAQGLTVVRSKPASRDAAADVPREAIGPLFLAHPGEPFQAETSTGFVVGVPAEIVAPDPKADAAGYDALRSQLRNAVAADVEQATIVALRDRLKPRVNAPVIERTIQ